MNYSSQISNNTYFSHENFTLLLGDSCELLSSIKGVSMIFADPPYFLSNDGLTIESGKIVSVNKGDWDKQTGDIDNFNRSWLKAAKQCLAPNGTIWICGTLHNIFSIVKVLEELDFKILNTITWQKTNPPPNFSCRCFTHSTEFIIWARREKKKAHYFNYELMKELNGGKQMKDVWTFPSIAPWEKKNGKHPTQKPLTIVARTILASTKKGDLILDPFTGSSTTGIAANLLGRKFIGIDKEDSFLRISKNRFDEIQGETSFFLKKIKGLNMKLIQTFDK